MIAALPTRNWSYGCSLDGSLYSGDFVDNVCLEPGRNVVFVGDVAGSGRRAHAAARKLALYVRSLIVQGASLTELFEQTDRFFERAVLEEAIPFVSLFAAVEDAGERRLRYSSGGHDTAILFSSGTSHMHLSPTGPLLGLGLDGAATFAERSVPLADQSLLVVVTDGITDARPPEGSRAFFGSRGVVRAIASSRAAHSDPAQAVYRAASRHAKHQLSDDASVVIADLGLLQWGARC
jgi:sigma-B regulation protein RsbU (phosphoserine phosphatase)